jgi:outer membrane protein OmpA-like peptidoglycan-associated protein
MRNRVLSAAGALALIPALAIAQQRPAQRPAQPPAQRPAQPPAQRPAQRPAAQPAQRPAQRPAAMAAHREKSIELSIGGGVMYMDGLLLDAVNAGLGNTSDASRIYPGGTVRLGYNFTRNLGVSVGSSLGTGSGVTLINPLAALTYTFDINKKTSPFVTVGGQLLRVTGQNSQRVTSKYGGHAGIGVRHMVGENLAVRVEGRMQYDKFEESPDPTYNSWGMLGISYFAGGGPPRDTDADGVPDKRDRCASTPRGATVDVRGCPSDTDRDGVLNGLDRCADTPANTPVDANGCTRDTDRDGIADNADRCPNTAAGTPVDATGCPRDTDRDGVPDNTDRCANTPAGTPVDANGCPRDSDSDGVMDNADRCPNTPAGTTVDANGCPRDSDGDGVADNADRCPNTAAGTQVDPTGCPVARDADNDGVVDANDRCANTPAGRRVDANGCPLAELPQVGQALVLRSILFRPGTARLMPSSNAALDQIATAVVATPGARWEIAGHTDSRGVAAQNQRLSQARAQAVATYLATKGVASAALTAVGYGSTRPVAPNTTTAGRAQNRRVEIKRVQ